MTDIDPSNAVQDKHADGTTTKEPDPPNLTRTENDEASDKATPEADGDETGESDSKR